MSATTTGDGARQTGGGAAAPGLQRAEGQAALTVRVAAGRTRIERLRQAGCLKLRFPRPDGFGAQGVLVNTAGGLTGGDRLMLDIAVEAGAALTLTTQGCERIYRASGGVARVETAVRIAAGARLSLLPQETILFDGGALARRIAVDCAADGRLLLVESVILGRTLMGERVRSGFLKDSWRIRRAGRLVFAEEARFAGPVEAIARSAASLDGACAFATLVLVDGQAASRLDAARALIGEAGGASAFDGLLVARLVAARGDGLRRRLIPLLCALADEPLPRVWST